MSRQRQISTSEGCALCHESPIYFAVGPCNHPVCFRCSAKMRVLNSQMYCATCRSDLKEVAVTTELKTFNNINTTAMIVNKKYSMFFETKKVEEDFLSLLEHRCRFCEVMPFNRFRGLSNHVRTRHNLHYCMLCVENLTLFPDERQAYTRKQFERHMVEGDENDPSHKGHPYCEFCNRNFFDNDNLWRHLRKDHYYCHFCDKEGPVPYYKDYPNMKEHFREQHYLCEEGECADLEFTNAYRSDIDYQAHMVKEHPRVDLKGRAKNERKLVLDWDSNSSRPRGPGQGPRRRRDFDAELDDARSRGRGGRGGRGGHRGASEDVGLRFALQASLREAQDRERLATAADKAAATTPAGGRGRAGRGRGGGTKGRPVPSDAPPQEEEGEEQVAPPPDKEEEFTSELTDFPMLGAVASSSSSLQQSSDQGDKAAGHDSLAGRVAFSAGSNVGGLQEEAFPELSSGPSRLDGFRKKGAFPSSGPRGGWIGRAATGGPGGRKPQTVAAGPSRPQPTANVYRTDADFPSLPGPSGRALPLSSSSFSVKPTSGAKSTKGSGARPKSYVSSAPPTSLAALAQTLDDEDDFPLLGRSAQAISSVMMMARPPPTHVRQSGFHASSSDFPSLGGGKGKKGGSVAGAWEASGPKAGPTDAKPVQHDGEAKAKKKKKKKPKTESTGKDDKTVDAPPSQTEFPCMRSENVENGKPEMAPFVKSDPDPPKESKPEQREKTRSTSPLSETTIADSVDEIGEGKAKAKTDLKKVAEVPINLVDDFPSLPSKPKVVTAFSRTSSASVDTAFVKPRPHKTSSANSGFQAAENAVDDFPALPSKFSILESSNDASPSDLSYVNPRSEKKQSGKTKSNFKISDNDFPSLPSGPSKPPPGFGPQIVAKLPQPSRPPPGFGDESKPAQPPPGFDGPSSLADVAAGLTLADIASSLSGSSASTAAYPQPQVQEYTYTSPQDYSERNSELITRVRYELDEETGKFDQFKSLSIEFRGGSLSAAKYVAECKILFPVGAFESVFTELIALLPDVVRQQELLRKVRELKNALSTCPTCGQVLAPRDVALHAMVHEMQ